MFSDWMFIEVMLHQESALEKYHLITELESFGSLHSQINILLRLVFDSASCLQLALTLCMCVLYMSTSVCVCVSTKVDVLALTYFYLECLNLNLRTT